ncbi:hypothetical protein GCM10010345_84150 [Streptomyces canarius]|uniref:Uncharacterized protein n=1 Tax=Streptomyces canarius TaxID=285453 RepID=A0ABQ3D917_9ACTN|nr:hypothetical protein GCM10010345_84150 [Streptomyces canarius]
MSNTASEPRPPRAVPPTPVGDDGSSLGASSGLPSLSAAKARAPWAASRTESVTCTAASFRHASASARQAATSPTTACSQAFRLRRYPVRMTCPVRSALERPWRMWSLAWFQRPSHAYRQAAQ